MKIRPIRNPSKQKTFAPSNLFYSSQDACQIYQFVETLIYQRCGILKDRGSSLSNLISRLEIFFPGGKEEGRLVDNKIHGTFMKRKRVRLAQSFSTAPGSHLRASLGRERGCSLGYSDHGRGFSLASERIFYDCRYRRRLRTLPV